MSERCLQLKTRMYLMSVGSRFLEMDPFTPHQQEMGRVTGELNRSMTPVRRNEQVTSDREGCLSHLYRKWLPFAKMLYFDAHKLSSGPNRTTPDNSRWKCLRTAVLPSSLPRTLVPDSRAVSRSLSRNLSGSSRKEAMLCNLSTLTSGICPLCPIAARSRRPLVLLCESHSSSTLEATLSLSGVKGRAQRL